jgi:hypothetical protein
LDGPPALKVAGLQIWVPGREFPDATDAGDGNWLRITGCCGALGARVLVDRHILEVTDIRDWARQCALLLNGEAEHATLAPAEPESSAVVDSPDALGPLRMSLAIPPDRLTHKHAFEFEVDRSYSPAIIKQCEEIMREYPVRGR